MKTNIIKTALFLACAGGLMTSCGSDPEVGSTLYPTAPEDFSAKAYINIADLQNNELNFPVVQAGDKTIKVPKRALPSVWAYHVQQRRISPLL